MISARVKSVDGKVVLVGRLNRTETNRMRRGLDVMTDLFAITGDKDTSQAMALGALVVEKYGHEEVSDEPA